MASLTSIIITNSESVRLKYKGVRVDEQFLSHPYKRITTKLHLNEKMKFIKLD